MHLPRVNGGLAGSKKLFHYLHYGLAAVLVFVGGKMLLAGFYKIPTLTSLLVVASLIHVAPWATPIRVAVSVRDNAS